MSPFTIRIDHEKCTDCGLCAEDCVSACMLMIDGKAVPANPQWCNRCSHCVAVCPAEAVIHEGLKGAGSRAIINDRIDADCYREIVMTRRSVRWYKPDQVPKEELEQILNLANYSPTASNTMDVGYSVITDKEFIDETGRKIFALSEKLKRVVEKPGGKAIARVIDLLSPGSVTRYLDRYGIYKSWTDSGRNLITHNAPVLIVIHGPKKGRFVRENCAIAAANITNYAHARGLGTCYIGFLSIVMDRSRKLEKNLGVPEGRKGYLALVMGRPAVKYSNVPVRPEAYVTWRE
jgi:nitroreductase/NAD-dependent dihydropyrimidine dehydrogenase PreA subunit